MKYMKKVTVVLDNIRSTYNVGAILRTAEGLGVSRVVLTGVTPNWLVGLPHVREKNLRQIHKSALGAEELVPTEYIEDINKWLENERSSGQKIVALEQSDRSVMIGRDDVKEALGDSDIILVLGEEVHGVDKGILENADVILEIPMRGKKESFNVSVAAGIALFAILA